MGAFSPRRPFKTKPMDPQEGNIEFCSHPGGTESQRQLKRLDTWTNYFQLSQFPNHDLGVQIQIETQLTESRIS